MNDAEVIISGIEQKVKNLIDQHHLLKTKYIELKKREEELKTIIEQYKTTIKELEEKNSMLKISGSFGSGSDSEEVREKITSLVREIDKCIDLLNR